MPADTDHPFADLPVTQRIDLTLAVLSSMEVQEAGGWPVATLAELCGCSEAAIHARQQRALELIRTRAAHLIAEIRPSLPLNSQPSTLNS